MAKIKMTETKAKWVTAANDVLGPVTTVNREDIQRV